MPTPAAKAKKDEGNVFFKNKDYEKAIEKYSEAIALDGSDVTFFSNRSVLPCLLEAVSLPMVV